MRSLRSQHIVSDELEEDTKKIKGGLRGALLNAMLSLPNLPVHFKVFWNISKVLNVVIPTSNASTGIEGWWKVIKMFQTIVRAVEVSKDSYIIKTLERYQRTSRTVEAFRDNKSEVGWKVKSLWRGEEGAITGEVSIHHHQSWKSGKAWIGYSPHIGNIKAIVECG